MRLSEAIEALLLATQANGRSSRTVEAYREKLSYLLEALGDVPVETITVADLRRYVAGQLARTTDYQPDNPPSGSLSPFTVAGRVRALKRLFNFLVDEELLDANPARRIKTPHPRRVIPMPVSEAARLAGLTPELIRWLVKDGDIDAQEVGGELLIEKASLSEWLEALEDLACIQAVQAAKAEE